MNKNLINGHDLAVMIENGAKLLSLDCERINALNVFPVPDGDTGANMKMTIEGGVPAALAMGDADIYSVSKTASKSMVMSARGNSGVILSQFFKGFSIGLEGLTEASTKDVVNAFLTATKRCYEVVTNPTEGTILTVMREAGEFVSKNFNESLSMPEVFHMYLEEANRSLARTPELLPCLKEAGVVDSGAAGFILIVEGMYKALIGEIIDISHDSLEDALVKDFDLKYEAECSDSKTTKEHKKYAIVSVANGEGIKQLFTEIGVDVVVSGGQTMNTSTADFIEAFKTLNADYILVYPNNGNIRMAAQAAADNYDGAKVVVIPTKTISQGYSAVSMLNLESEIEDIISQQQEQISYVSTIEVTFSIRSCVINGIDIKKDDTICLLNDNLVSANKSRLDAIKESFKNVSDIKDKNLVSVIYGKDANEDEVNELVNFISSLNPFIEVYPVHGDQDIYSYIIGIE